MSSKFVTLKIGEWLQKDFEAASTDAAMMLATEYVQSAPEQYGKVVWQKTTAFGPHEAVFTASLNGNKRAILVVWE